MRNRRYWVLAFALLVVTASKAQTDQMPAQSSALLGVPRLIKFSGVLKDSPGQLLNGSFETQFSVYSESSGGTPLWEENQNVQFSEGNYTVMLGEATNGGIPAELFANAQTRWVGVRVLLPNEQEQPRVMLASVPYALKAVDADTVGGLPASAFMLAAPTNGGETASSFNQSAAILTSSGPLTTSNVTTTGGTVNTVPLFTTATNIQNSIVTQTGTTAINIGGALSVTNAGSFTGASSNNYLSSIVNNAQWDRSDVAQEPSQIALLGAIQVPSGATSMHNLDGVYGYAESSCNSNVGTQCNAVGGYFVGNGLANGAAVWGINPLVQNAVGTTHGFLAGGEFDVGCNGVCDLVRGVVVQNAASGSCTAPGCDVAAEFRSSGAFGTPTVGWHWTTILRLADDVSATSSANNCLGSTKWDSQIWDGSATALEELNLSVGCGTGSNPFVNYVWSHPSGSTNNLVWGPQSPLQLGLFTTSDASVMFPLSITAASYNKTITVPNDNSANAYMMVTGQNAITKSQRFGATTATATTAYATATTTYSWTNAFGDANYTPTCTPGGTITGTPVFQGITDFTASSVTVQVMAATDAASGFGSVNCIAVHD